MIKLSGFQVISYQVISQIIRLSGYQVISLETEERPGQENKQSQRRRKRSDSEIKQKDRVKVQREKLEGGGFSTYRVRGKAVVGKRVKIEHPLNALPYSGTSEN